MIKKGILLILTFLLSLSLVSAGLFSGFFDRVTGAQVVELACADSDNGDYYVQGIMKTSTGDNQDVCTDENTLVEYTCKENLPYKEAVTCTCKEGACQKEVSLEDFQVQLMKLQERIESLELQILDLKKQIASGNSGDVIVIADEDELLTDDELLDEDLLDTKDEENLLDDLEESEDFLEIDTDNEEIVCGDTVCQDSETVLSCATDCLNPLYICGDGTCEGPESITNCREDCGESGDFIRQKIRDWLSGLA